MLTIREPMSEAKLPIEDRPSPILCPSPLAAFSMAGPSAEILPGSWLKNRWMSSMPFCTNAFAASIPSLILPEMASLIVASVPVIRLGRRVK